MKMTEIRERTTKDLETLEAELIRKLWKSRLDNYTNQLDDTSQLGKLRRDIARVKTVRLQRAEEGK